MTTKPLSPKDYRESTTSVPDQVIDEFNKAILEGRGVVRQDGILKAIADRMGVSQHHVLAHKWLDVEHIYRAAGWVVTYNKPAYNEDFEAYFTFQPVAGK